MKYGPLSTDVRDAEIETYLGPLNYHRLTLIPTGISNHSLSKWWNEINKLFPNFSGCTVEVWEWLSNSNEHLIMYMAAYPFWE